MFTAGRRTTGRGQIIPESGSLGNGLGIPPERLPPQYCSLSRFFALVLPVQPDVIVVDDAVRAVSREVADSHEEMREGIVSDLASAAHIVKVFLIVDPDRIDVLGHVDPCEHNVHVHEDPALARSLYVLELGQEVPEEFYVAIAEVLAFVYRLDMKMRKRKGL